MSQENKEGRGENAPGASVYGDPDTLIDNGTPGQSSPDAPQDTSRLGQGKLSLSTIRRDRNPARGFLLAIPAGVALWAVAIYLLLS